MTQDGTKCEFKIWNTAGQKRFIDIVKQYLNDNNIDGFIIAFDLTNRESFNYVKELIEMVKNRRKKQEEDPDDLVPHVIVGNKLDLCPQLRVIEENEARNFAQVENNGMSYFETSAKTDIGVKEMMETIMEQTYLAKRRRDANSLEEVSQSESNASGGD